MADPRLSPRPITPIRLTSLPSAGTDSRLAAQDARAPRDGKVLCDRCGAEVYRMHAVWRCPACGFKSDCCGW